MFATLVIAACSICFMMPEPEPENSDDDESESEAARRARYMACSIEETSDPEIWQSLHHHDYSSESDESPVGQNECPILDERIPLRPSMLRCYALLSTSFTRLKQLMIRDPRQRGRGFAVLYQLQQVFMSFEENRPNSNNYSLLHQRMASISNMEEVAQVQISSSFEIDGTDVLVERLNQDPELQPEAEMPTDDERGDAPMYEGDIPAAHES